MGIDVGSKRHAVLQPPRLLPSFNRTLMLLPFPAGQAPVHADPTSSNLSILSAKYPKTEAIQDLSWAGLPCTCP
ncbi:hypothetical protein LX36DRAFT_298869 [Colletotrichum falcatum]|nr:hypothetical protein LX36DRAFT_298869 [Colletotrichum falcatum]